ncbi:amino acid permease [Crossiella sp. CA-258035]|uniref:APC family permease n=1 Tax=Crossiella sp. CA-258035 TaxID=2981138 RepID=UPI0024BCF603|nr:amino acid permease [Crossiella sp. CA-258035]WHT16072.1 amino acid permease [Crossiella sp. CA-258035]
MTTVRSDDAELQEFGYRQELKRTLGNFHTFAAGISYISILTGTFQLFYLGFAQGGPAYWWSWPMVFAGQLMVALCFAELAARYPIAGSIYNWAKRLSNPHVSWLAGWLMLAASATTVAATALALQITLPQIWDGFQLVPDNPTNAVVLASILIVFTTIINACGVKLMARINSAGVLIELIAAVIMVVVLAAFAVRGPSVVLETHGTGEGNPLGYMGAFLAASLASLYVMYGFDTAASLGEESKDPCRNAPKSILRAVTASFVIGGLLLLFALMAVRDINAPELGTIGLQYIVLDVLGPVVGKIFLVTVAIAIVVCVLAVHTAAIRMMFAMARDNNLPGGAKLAKVSARFQTPVLPALLIGAFGIAFLMVNIGQPQIFSVVTSIAIILIYLAYLLVTVPLLIARFRGRWPLATVEGAEPRFGLGKWGLPVNIVAVLWGAAMVVNLLWPRQAIYNPSPPFHWYLQWGAVLFVGAVTIIGFAYYWFVQRHRSGVLADHAHTPAVAAPMPEVR